MAQYTTSTIYSATPQQSDPNVLIIDGGSPSLPYTITNNDPSSTQFSVGEELLFTREGYSNTGIYLGRTPTGIIAEVGGDAYYLGSSVYSYGDVITMAAEPFPVCFVKGTLIKTSRGPVAIECLVSGDTVLGSTGWREVKWLGYRQYGPASFISKESAARIAPVRIRAHAFADNMPDRDLLTSPWHHLLVDGKLVRAHDLINGDTVIQETHVSEVAYYHVELDQFDVIMAHGVYSESWADGGNRSFFQNADVTALRPEDGKRRRASRPGFDHLVLREGKKLEAIQKRVTQRAQSLTTQETAIAKAA